MSDNLDLKINLDIATNGADKLEAQRKEFDKLAQEIREFARDAKAASSAFASLGKGRTGATGAADDVKNGRAALDLDRARYGELKRIFVFQRRMASQEKRENDDIARQLRAQEKAKEKALQDQARATTRAAKDRAKAEADAERRIQDNIRETTRMRERADRKALQDAEKMRRAQEQAAERAARGAGQVRSGAGRVAQTGAAAAAVMGYGAARAIQRGVHTRADADEAETNIRIFNDVDDGKGGRRKLNADDIRKLRRGPAGLDRLAVDTGTSVPETLRAYNESAKAGLIDPMAQTRNVLKAGAALELDPGKTTKLLGTLARNMGAAGTPDRLYKTLNAVGIGAREDPTQSNEIIEGLNRSQGLLSMSRGFTPEDLVAMVSGGQSVGIQPGKAGTSITALASSILQGGNKLIDPKKRKELNFAAKHLGFGSAKNMASQFAGENGKAAYYQIMKGLQGMAPQLRQQVADALSGGQWSDEDLQIVNGIDGQIKTDKEIHDPKNAHFIDEAAAEKMKSWKMLWAQSQTIFSLFWESFGVGFDSVLREINAFFLDLNGKFDYDQVSQYVRDALDGLKEGLGIKTWTDGLKSIFPDDISGLGQGIKDFARGVGAGLRSMGDTLRSVGSMFGMGGGAETIGNLAAKFFTLSAACIALAPVIGVIGGLGSIVLGIVGMARAAMAVLGGGAGAATGAAGGALAGIARMLAGGFVVGLAGALGNLRGEISTMILSAVRPLVEAIWTGLKQAFSWEGIKSGGAALLNEIVPAPLRRWLDGDGKPDAKAEGSHWTDPPARSGTSEAPAPEAPVEKLKAEVEKQTQILQRQLEVDQKALDAAQVNKDAKTAATTPTPNADGAVSYEDWRRQFSGLHGAQLGRALEAQKARTGGTPLPDTGMRRNGVIGGDTASGGGSGSRSFRNSNPGNLRDGPFARRLGATGRDSAGFAVFPNYETGRRAQEQLLFGSDSYKNLSIADAIKRYAPGSDGNDPVGYAASMARAAGVDVGTRMGDLTPDQRRRFLDAQQAREGWRAGSGSGTPSAPGSAGGAVDTLSRYLGQNEYTDRVSLSRFVGHDVAGAVNAWCSRAVNASLASVGIKGTGSATANSFQRWGFGINPKDVARGDVLLSPNGRGPGQQGGHVGLATGRTRFNPQTGRLELERIAGNEGDAVRQTWVDAQKLMVRRAQESMNPKVSPEAIDGQRPSAAGPSRNAVENVPVRAGAGASYGRVGHNVNTQIHINGHNKSPEELAGTVQRHLQDSMNRRTHDFDGFA